MSSFYITTLGCKVNQYESDGIARELCRRGWIRTKTVDTADLFIVNTCAVTARAAQQARKEIRRLIRTNPGARMIVTGCHAQTAAHDIQEIRGVDHVVGHQDKFRIAQAVHEGFAVTIKPPPLKKDDIKAKAIADSPAAATLPLPHHQAESCTATQFLGFDPAVTGRHTRGYLKIQDGCNAFCTYCIVPHARGRSRSMPQDQVLRHLKALRKSGYREAILTGIHLGAYGQDFIPPLSFTDLLDNINAARPIDRIRISSVEPLEITDAMLSLVARSPLFCDHLHIPLQSGDDTVLKRMKRPYDTALFIDRVRRIRRLMPDAAVGVDILVGFPGESRTAFENTFQLIQALPVTYLHVFPFSPREGTPAFHFKDKVDPGTIRKRCAALRKLGKKKQTDFFREQLGRPLQAVIQKKDKLPAGMLLAVTSNYLTIRIQGEASLRGRLIPVVAEHLDNGQLLGRPV